MAVRRLKSAGATSGVDRTSIKSTTSLISERERQQEFVDEALTVAKSVADRYNGSVLEGDFQVADIGRSNAIAYYDAGGNLAINKRYFNREKITEAYDRCVARGFHPSRGGKSAVEAVVSHEMGHKLTSDVARKMGYPGFDGISEASNKIISQAAKKMGVKVGALQSGISGYAQHNNAETVAEAFSDVWCNGAKASASSRAVVEVMDSYLKTKK